MASGFTAVQMGVNVALSWTNPSSDVKFDHVVIVRKLGGVSVDIQDGTVIYQGHDTGYTDPGVPIGQEYYTIFVCDRANVCSPTGVSTKVNVVTPFAISSVDNSQLPSFPPIRSQGAISPSCVSWATTYYTMSYMTARERGWDITSTTDNTNKFSPEFIYNRLNGGVGNSIVSTNANRILVTSGGVMWSDFPYIDGEYTKWLASGAAYRKALNYRISPGIKYDAGGNPDALANTENFITNIDTVAGQQAIRAKLLEGYILYVGVTNFFGFKYAALGNDQTTAADDPYVGQSIVTYGSSGAGGGHAMTIVGYNDDLWVDINNNGSVDPKEKGAFKIAHSGGTSYRNNGFIWIAYDAIAASSAIPEVVAGQTNRIPVFQPLQTAVYVDAAPVYSPKIVAEFTINHAKRSQVNAWLGIGSVANNDQTPVKTLTPWGRFLNEQGGAFPLDGSTAADVTYVYDFTDLAKDANADTRWFLVLKDGIAGDPLTLKSFKLYDATAVAGDVMVGSYSVVDTFDGPAIRSYHIDWPYNPANNNTPPTISAISNVAVAPGTNIVLPFVASDVNTPLSRLAFRLTSSNPTIIANGAVTYNRSGANPVATIMPRAGAYGSLSMTLRVTDEGGLWAETTFNVTIANQ